MSMVFLSLFLLHRADSAKIIVPLQKNSVKID